MRRVETERPVEEKATGEVSIYCLASFIVEEAQANGCRGFAKSLETALAELLAGMPRNSQAQALRLSYEMALGGESAARPKLRLVYSRD
ncbi:MAG TPA: hypothetical protein VI582_06630 [Aestuariivirga sp.]|nr:hypothetical protein [Aestuariivirga sp.]